MIQSCIRDLFEIVFGTTQNNKNEAENYYNPKLFMYLTKNDIGSKKVLFNDKYKNVFGKY